MFPLIVAREHVHSPSLSDGIELIDKYDAGGMLDCLHKKVSYPRRPDTDKHLDKVRTGKAEEGNPGLARDCASKQGFPCTRRPHDQNALGDTPTQSLVLIRIF